MPTLYVAVTNHGFGHATRAAAVAAATQQLAQTAGLPLKLILATQAPKWLLDSYLAGSCYTHRRVSFDVGVLQSDSLTMDKPATLKALQDICDRQAELIEQEAAFLREANVDLVLADMPPLMAKIARTAEIPCWMMSNFGWDFIYRPWGEEMAGFTEIADWISDCFSQANRTFRLPFHEPMAALPNMSDVGLTGGTPAYSPDYLRQLLQRDIPPEQTALLTFGGLGLSTIPYTSLAELPDWQFVTFDRHAPDLPNLYKVTDRAMRPVDWMVVCDRVVSKPGYSTFSEACRLDKGLITLTREGFAEAPILIEGIQDYMTHQVVPAEAFFAGDWSFITRELQPPRKLEKLDKNGNTAIAAAIVAHLQG